MRLFDDIQRVEEGPSGHSVGTYRFLNESGRPEVARVREILSEWFSKYPSESQEDLSQRFKAKDDRQFRSAFFELLVHEALSRMGFALNAHPALERVSTKTDFRITDGMGKEANLECRVAFTGSYRDDRGSSLLNVLYDLLDKRLAGIDYFLKLDIEGSPSQAPSARQFETFIRNRLKSLPPASDPEYLSEAVDTVVWEYVIDEACKIKVSPIPKSVDAKGNPVDRPLGMFVGPVRFIQDSREIAEAIREKVGKYGALSIPFLIAVNCLGAFVEMRDVVDGLFGNVSTLVANRGGKPTVVGQRRDTERAIFDTRQGKNTVLSGVLVGRNLDPYDFPRRSLTFFPNPHAARPFSFGNEYVGSCSCGDGYIRTVEGKKLFSLFCVSEEWPMKE